MLVCPKTFVTVAAGPGRSSPGDRDLRRRLVLAVEGVALIPGDPSAGGPGVRGLEQAFADGADLVHIGQKVGQALEGVGGSPDEQFQLELDFLLDGIAARLTAGSRHP
jgi:hypothetical protein